MPTGSGNRKERTAAPRSSQKRMREERRSGDLGQGPDHPQHRTHELWASLSPLWCGMRSQAITETGPVRGCILLHVNGILLKNMNLLMVA